MPSVVGRPVLGDREGAGPAILFKHRFENRLPFTNPDHMGERATAVG